jgi:hypothetical protein
MNKNQTFDEQFYLDQLGSDVGKDDYESSLQKLNKLCINRPFKTPLFVKAFEQAWCMKTLNLLKNNYFDEAGIRMRSIYMFIKYSKAFNQLVVIYFEKIGEKEISKSLEGHDKAIHLSMQSQYFYQKGEYEKANNCVIECFKEIKPFFNEKVNNSNVWLLIQKSLKNIKDKKIGEDFLNQILVDIKI